MALGAREDMPGEAGLDGLSTAELQKALEAERRVSASLRAELQKAQEEIQRLRALTCRPGSPDNAAGHADATGKVEKLHDAPAATADVREEAPAAQRLSSGSDEATAAKGSYVKAAGKVYWVSYEDPEQLIRLPSARMSGQQRPAAREDTEVAGRRSSGHENFLPGTPDHRPRLARPASLDARALSAAGPWQQAPHICRTGSGLFCVQGHGSGVYPGIARQFSANSFPVQSPRRVPQGLPQGLQQGLPQGVPQVWQMQRHISPAASLPPQAGHVQSIPMAGRFQPVGSLTRSWTPRGRCGASLAPMGPVEVPRQEVLPAKASLQPSTEMQLRDLQANLKRLQDLQKELAKQVG
ncbi:unnamed protein product [Effrenium voratum]|uniref:Uncharacterized protein n=2 Tax=Effrenium voratum TaxID=2562239 RepID=A0AA36NGG1_9DINO|nr:unnamed protein product [Effrenium voratum]CAJ1428147.1 unnamed protein product [Effrenium voratum]